MRYLIVAVGHRQPVWVDTAFSEYAKRLPREGRIELITVKPEHRPERASEETIAGCLKKEAIRIEKCLENKINRIALDERGEPVSTRQLSEHMRQWLQEGQDVAFIIGGADGLDPALKRSARARLSLSKMTLPHGLVRVLLAEQLYRAHTLLNGHPYHRD